MVRLTDEQHWFRTTQALVANEQFADQHADERLASACNNSNNSNKNAYRNIQ
jgi:predicted secreted protein